jgi:peptide/nickel transport system substrate-binding protein
MSENMIGRYEIRRELGRGGMATVYVAHDPRFERDVAIKVLPLHFTHDPQFRARFEREAKTIAALENPAIVPVYDFGERDGQPYLVMRFMTGGSLEERMVGEAYSLAATSPIISRIALALDQAHSKDIIHRDLKPGNVLFDAGDLAYLSDFGIVKLAQETSSLTGTAIIGTPGYMSPEQGMGQPLDRRADIYSLGVILFELLTGRLPFESETPMGMIIQHINATMPDPQTINPDIPDAVAEVILTSTAKTREERYATAGLMAAALKSILRASRLSVVIPKPAPVVVEKVIPPPKAPSRPPASSAEAAPSPPPPILAAEVAAQVKPRFWKRIPAWGWVGSIVLLCMVAGIISVTVAISQLSGGTDTGAEAPVALTTEVATSDAQDEIEPAREPAGTSEVSSEPQLIPGEMITPAETAPQDVASQFVAPQPDTYTQLTFGDIVTMDPSLNYDNASSQLLENVMEGLIYYNHSDATTYVPQLATEVPSLENGLISEDGLAYTFPIREGVTFHGGGTLEPHDVAYTFQRGLLQSDPNSPQWLLLEPILGFSNCYDISEAIDPECGLAGDPELLRENASGEQLTAACELVKAAVVADDDAGTVTFNLAKPWGPFLATIAHSSGYILDGEWAIEQGAWDGDCSTWQNYYAPGSENSELTNIVNGTGPYMLDYWTPGEEYFLTANPNYWRTEPAWDGGPSGEARIKTVVVRLVDEWGTRFATLQAGDAESVSVPVENRPQADAFVGEFCDWRTNVCQPNPDNPDGPLRKWADLPNVFKTDIFMTFDISEDPLYIGNGRLDGKGIPPDFFSDIHVRRAMNYCFDYSTYIDEALNGEGIRNNGPIIQDMLGYNPDGELYEFDLQNCEEELAQAWGGVLPETGFRFSIAYNTGNLARQTVGEILQANLNAINPNYQVDVVGLPWPEFLSALRSSQIPVVASGWTEDIHDPHNWVQPFTVGIYAGFQQLPDDLKDQFRDLVNAGVATTDPAEREQIYFELQRLHHDQAFQIPLAQTAGVRYEQRWVEEWFNRPGAFGSYWYAYDLAG